MLASSIRLRGCPLLSHLHLALQDLAAKLQSDCRRGLPVDDEADCSMRVEAFGSNRLAEREEVSFGQLVLEALQVRLR